MRVMPLDRILDAERLDELVDRARRNTPATKPGAVCALGADHLSAWRPCRRDRRGADSAVDDVETA